MLTVHDTITLLESLFCEPSAPAARLELARPVLYGEGSPLEQFKVLTRSRRTRLFQTMQAGLVDGYSVVAAQQGWGLFNPGRSLEASQWTFERFRTLDVLGQIREELSAAASYLSAHLPNELNVFLLPADPANRALMLRAHGLSVFAGLPDALLIQLWPSEGNLSRLDAALTRALVHIAEGRDAEPLTLRAVLEREKRAAELVSGRFPAFAEPQLLSFRAPENWESALAHAATLCGAESYDALKANIYGGDGASVEPVPSVSPLEERAYVHAVLLEHLGETQPTRIAACLYGDEVVAAQGHPGMGAPLFAGLQTLTTFTARSDGARA